jgi:hypothetical protein
MPNEHKRGNAILEPYKKLGGLRESNSSFFCDYLDSVMNQPNLDEVNFLKSIKKRKHFKNHSTEIKSSLYLGISGLIFNNLIEI